MVLLHNTVGQNNPQHKLTADQAKSIYLSCKNKVCRRELAALFGVSIQSINNIANKKFWLSVTRDL